MAAGVLGSTTTCCFAVLRSAAWACWLCRRYQRPVLGSCSRKCMTNDPALPHAMAGHTSSHCYMHNMHAVGFVHCILQRDLQIFGRTVAQPRLIAYMADPDTPPYTYSGLTLQPTPWSQVGKQRHCS